MKEIFDNCFNYKFSVIKRLITCHYNKAFRGLEINSTQFLVLCFVDGKDITQSESFAGLGMDRTTLSRCLNVLIRNKLVEKVKDAHNNKSKIIKVTELGKEAIKKAT